MISFTQLGRWGGLGNQLWEYAALLGIGAELGFEVRLPPPGAHQLAEVFAVSTPVASRRELRRLRHVYEDDGIRWDPAYRQIADWTDLRGYFQSPRYFPADGILRRELTFRPEVAAPASRAVEELRRDGTTLVGVTVRRGDYLLRPEQFRPVWAGPYYDAAVRHVRREVGGPLRFVVSSDDPVWCRVRFADAPDTVVLDGLTDPSQLAVLASCDHLILANSSFAWWSAWLRGGDGLVLAPDRWWGSECRWPDRDREPLPDGWIALDS